MDLKFYNRPADLKLNRTEIKELVHFACHDLKLELKSCHIIFSSNALLRSLHKTYLNDANDTDVLTFNLGEDEIEGEIYISWEQVKLNARKYNVSSQHELLRIIIHALLHLKGYDDLEESERREMKKLEESLLNKASRQWLQLKC